MALSFEKIVTSPIFTFVVGPERTPITLHNALVAHHSLALNTLMNGSMSEAKVSQAEMVEIDVPTFARFSQWLYTGLYDVPYCKGHSHMSLERENQSENCGRAWDCGLNSKQRKRKQQQMLMDGTWEDRITQYDVDEARAVSASLRGSANSVRKQILWTTFTQSSDFALDPPPRKNSQSMSVNWIEILLGHARLYCFADLYGIASLQKLCSDAMGAALIDFDCEGDQVDVLVQLINYTMANTPSTDPQGTQSLRAIVLDFTVIVFETLIENASFKELLHMNNDLSVDILGLLTKRLD